MEFLESQRSLSEVMVGKSRSGNVEDQKGEVDEMVVCCTGRTGLRELCFEN